MLKKAFQIATVAILTLLPFARVAVDAASADKPAIQVQVNGGEDFTRELKVSVEVRVLSNEIGENAQVRFLACTSHESCAAQHPNGDEWQTWQDLSKFLNPTRGNILSTQIDLAEPFESGKKNICVQIRSSGGDINDYACDFLYYDTQAIFNINQNAEFTNTRGVNLNFGQNTAANYVRVWNEKEEYAAQIVPFSRSIPWQLSLNFETKRVYVQLLNILHANGNYTDTPLVDHIAYAPEYGVEFLDSSHTNLETTISNFPRRLNVGENANLRFGVKNIGSLVWPKAGINIAHPVNISYHWQSLSDPTANTYNGNRGVLNQVLKYSELDSNISLNVQTPQVPGTYKLILDAVHEGVTWFSQVGAATRSIEVEISNEEYQYNVPGPATIPNSDLTAAAVTYYTVQPPRPWDPNWACGGYDCYSAIAEQFYQCSARGIPNYAFGTDEKALKGMCWWPIYNANRHLPVPPAFADRPWSYLLIGWQLIIPGFGDIPPSNPSPITNHNGVLGASVADLYAGLSGANSGWAKITFDRFVAWDGSWKNDQIKWSETTRPDNPTITSILTDSSTNSTTIYGVGIPKNHPMSVAVWNEYRYCWACGSGWEYSYQLATAQHVKIVLFKSGWQYIGHVWNDSPDGRWQRTLPLGTSLNPGDQIYAEVQVEADYTFNNLHWWSNTLESVNFNLRNPRYTGYPYFASGISNTLIVPNLVQDLRSIEEREIDNRAALLGATGAGEFTDICGVPGKYYSNLRNGQAGAIMFVNNRTVYSWGGTWDTYQYYGDRCDRFGVPTDDPHDGGVGQFNTAGAYQDFSKGRMYWSFKHLGKFTYGTISNKYEQAGGTNSSYGWPVSEVYTINQNGMTTNCQNFEGGTICESDNAGSLLDKFLQKEISYGINVKTGNIHSFCGTQIQDYEQLGGYGRSSLILNPNTNTIQLLTGGIAYTYFNNGACEKFGYPTNDPGQTYDYDGWWQEFGASSSEHTIYWHKTNQKAQGKWVSGAIRSYHNEQRGTEGELGFPQNNAIFETSTACDAAPAIGGYHQEFIGGKIYSSSLATVHMLYNDWLYHYWDKGEIKGEYGWPMTPVILANSVEQINFEKGQMIGTRGIVGLGWWIVDVVNGCSCQIKDDAGQCVRFIGEDIRGKSNAEVCRMATEGRVAVLDLESKYYLQCHTANYYTGFVKKQDTGEVLTASSAVLVVGKLADSLRGESVKWGTLGLIAFGALGIIALFAKNGGANAIADQIKRFSSGYGNIDPNNKNKKKDWGKEAREKGFRNKEKLTEHHGKHKGEFGAKSEQEYEQMAKEFLSREADGTNLMEGFKPSDGSRVLYEPSSNTFAVQDADGVIRTMFKPDINTHGYHTNIDYFLAQLK